MGLVERPSLGFIGPSRVFLMQSERTRRAVFFEIFIVFKSLGGGKLECLGGSVQPDSPTRTLDEDTIVPGKHNRLLKQKTTLHNTNDIVYMYRTRKSGFTLGG